MAPAFFKKKPKTKNMEYTVDYFIKKFEAIPEELWCTEAQYNLGSHCALGHCMTQKQKDELRIYKFGDGNPYLWGDDTEEGIALSKLFAKDSFSGSAIVAGINNGFYDTYKQPTPKQRILAALYDIKKLQQPEIKEKIVYVAFDAETVKLSKKELQKN